MILILLKFFNCFEYIFHFIEDLLPFSQKIVSTVLTFSLRMCVNAVSKIACKKKGGGGHVCNTN